MSFCTCPECMGGMMGGLLGGGMPGIGGFPGMSGMPIPSCGIPGCNGECLLGGMGGLGGLGGLGGMGGIPPCGIPGCTGQCLQQLQGQIPGCMCPQCQGGGMGGLPGLGFPGGGMMPPGIIGMPGGGGMMPPGIIGLPGGGGGGMMPPGIIGMPGGGGGGMMPPGIIGMPGGGGGGGGMPPPTFPGMPGGGGMPGPDFGAQPTGDSGAGSVPPSGPTINMDPKLRVYGATGQLIDCTIDTGMQTSAQINRSGFSKHFEGKVTVDTSVTTSLQGVGGAPTSMMGRFKMDLTLEHQGERMTVSGNCWIFPNDNTMELLLGMPFIKANKMNMRFDPSGDTVEIQGKKVPIDMITTHRHRIYPPGEPFYEGSGGKMFKLGGGTDSHIVPQAMHVLPHAPRHAGHHAPLIHGNHPARQARSKVSEDEDDDLARAVALSMENMRLNTANQGTHSRNLSKTLPHKENSYAQLQRELGLSVEDMARIISVQASQNTKKNETAAARNNGQKTFNEELDRAIAMSLEHFE